MSVSAIIAEYNPFHNGHLYQLENINCEYKIVIMSSSFTQRGTPSILNKFNRARLAIENGADLILELPVIYATSSAQIFAEGAISILNNLQIVDGLYFGSENNLEELIPLSYELNKVDKLNIKNYMSQGNSFIKSRELAMPHLSSNDLTILNKPNNILAIEYLKALNKFKSSITPHSIPRKNVDHSSKEAVENYASASLIRDLYSKNKIDELKHLVPHNTYNALLNSSQFSLNDLLKIFKYKILSETINYQDYMDYEIGLENRFYKFINDTDYETFISNISTKRYTKARIRRLILHILFDLKRSFILESLNHPYIRVLCTNKKGTYLLKKLKDNRIQYISNFSENFEDNFLNQIIKKEFIATSIYNALNTLPMNDDYTNQVFYKT